MFWGSPVQPDLIGMAFVKARGEAMKETWDLIPENVDVLITHTPPSGLLDKSSSGVSAGCEELEKKLCELNHQVHVFGHIHASYGSEIINNQIYINASNYNKRQGLVNPPVVFRNRKIKYEDRC